MLDNRNYGFFFNIDYIFLFLSISYLNKGEKVVKIGFGGSIFKNENKY
jgi:hypothetical protein